MQILAQFVVNILAFFLLLLILKKFAWGSLLKLIDERRQKIASEFELIEQTQQELAKLKADYQKQIDRIEEEARAKIQQAVDQGRRVAAGGGRGPDARAGNAGEKQGGDRAGGG